MIPFFIGRDFSKKLHETRKLNDASTLQSRQFIINYEKHHQVQNLIVCNINHSHLLGLPGRAQTITSPYINSSHRTKFFKLLDTTFCVGLNEWYVFTLGRRLFAIYQLFQLNVPG